jgi:hypothetical protein
VDAWVAEKEGTPGRPKTYSDLAIETGLTVRAIYHLALRQTEGLMGSIAKLMGLTIRIPDHTTFSRRAKALDISIIQRQSDGPIDIAVDSTGLKIYVGHHRRWMRARLGHGRRWRKLHLTVNVSTGEIVATEVTSNRKSDASAVPEQLEQVDATIRAFLADGAYDKQPVYDALKRHQPVPRMRVVIPPRKDAALSANASRRPTQRDKHIKVIRKKGREYWEAATGYESRDVVENAIYRYKTIIGRALRGRAMETQRTETRLGCKILNIMNRLVKQGDLAPA